MGTLKNPKIVNRLEVTKPGLYENYLKEHVSITDCAIYDTQVGVRAEDKIEQLKISGLAFGGGVTARMERHNGKDLPGLENTGECDAPPMESLLTNGFPAR